MDTSKTQEKVLNKDKKVNRKIRFITITFILVAVLWVFLLKPYLAFKNNEKSLTEAGRRYFDDNDHRKIYKLLSSKIGSYSEAMDNSREDEISKRYASAVVELRNVKNNM